MSTVAWETLHPLITPDVPGCPLEIVNRELAITASDFFSRTHLWRETLTSQSTVIDQSNYDVTECAVIESVQWVLVDNRELVHAEERLIDPERLTLKGRPTHFWVDKETEIRLYPIPDVVFSLDARIVLKPARNAKGIPSFAYEKWADAFVSGALYRIARTPGKEWTNPDQAALHKNIYEQAVTNARIRDFRNVDLQVNMRPFNGAKYGRR